MNGKKVTVLSTGAMGSALALALIRSGYNVTVWNRTQSRAQPLIKAGAELAITVEEAVERSDLIFAIPNPYSALKSYLLTEQILSKIQGKTILAMSSCGSTDQPIQVQQIVQDSGGYFLEGKIFSYPTEIGKPETPIAFSGEKKRFEHAYKAFMALGKPIYLSDRIEAAFIYECSVTSWFIATVGAMANGFALCQMAGIPERLFQQGVSASFAGLSDYLEKVVRDMIPQSNYDSELHGTASTAGVLEVAHCFSATFRRLGVHDRLLDAVLPAMKELKEQKKGHYDLAGLIEVFKFK